VVSPGNTYNAGLPTLYFGSLIDFAQSNECENSALRALGTEGRQPVAVAFVNETDAVVQMREPAELWVLRNLGQYSQRIVLGGASRRDTGHDVFHSNSGAGVACASCHAEGTDDGRVWDFSTGPRRTQALHRGLLATAPFHWSGDLPDLPHLIDEVLVGRMSGPRLDAGQETVLGRWLDRLPPQAVSPPADPQAVERGRLLFQDAAVGCSSCHNGPAFTNNATVDVGTYGGPFQVPSLLGVGGRAPYLHDGCARTLRERFVPRCGGGDRHGHTSQLSEAEIGDLVAYLETL
jgi:mono/diheme cytochrome c family protein